MPAVLRQGFEQIRMKFSRKNGTIREQLANPQPRKRAKRDFEAAGPIDSHRIRVFLTPVIPLGAQFVNVTLVSGEAVRFRQRDQMLVAIQFPNDFVISNFAEISNKEF